MDYSNKIEWRKGTYALYPSGEKTYVPKTELFIGEVARGFYYKKGNIYIVVSTLVLDNPIYNDSKVFHTTTARAARRMLIDNAQSLQLAQTSDTALPTKTPAQAFEPPFR